MRTALPLRRTRRRLAAALPLLTLGALAGCAVLPNGEPIEVLVAGIDPLDGQGLELRLSLRLRIQNPNDGPLVFEGVSLRLDVEGRRLATGVSPTGGTVPRFGELVTVVPVSASLFTLAQRAIDAFATGPREHLAYELTGRLAQAGGFGVPFRSKGELSLPTALGAAVP